MSARTPAREQGMCQGQAADLAMETAGAGLKMDGSVPEDGHKTMTVATPAAISTTCRAAPTSIVPRCSPGMRSAIAT